MKKATLILFTMAGLTALAAWSLYGCKGKTAPPPQAGEHAGHEREEGVKKTIYQCPMHPSYTSDKPGECPICGMKLVPIEEEGKEGAGEEVTSTVPGRVAIHISPERQQIIGVKTDSATKRPLVVTIRAVGRIAYDPDLYQAEKEYIESLRTEGRVRGSSGSRSLVDASVIRLRQLGLSEAMIEELSRTKRPSLNLLLPEETMWVYAQVYEYELSLVRVGQRVSVTSFAFPGEVFEGTLKAIDPVLDPMTRTVRVRALVKNPGKKLKPNVFVNVEIGADQGEGLVIPEDAVINTGTREIIFVDMGRGRLEPREVRTGLRLGDYTQVLEGLTEGERVVTSANFLIDSESSLKAAVKQMGSGHAGHGQ